MEDEEQDQSGAVPLQAAAPGTGAAKPGPSRRAQKRRRRRSNEVNSAQKKSSEEVEEGGGGGGGVGGGERGEKRQRNRQMSISSKAVANHVMKTRLLGSESDPLNLEGVGTEVDEGGGGGGGGRGGCSSCALSPVFGDSGQPVVPRPPLLQNPRDPLNLEGCLSEKTAAKIGGCLPVNHSINVCIHTVILSCIL